MSIEGGSMSAGGLSGGGIGGGVGAVASIGGGIEGGGLGEFGHPMGLADIGSILPNVTEGQVTSLEDLSPMGKSFGALDLLDLIGGSNQPGFNPAGEILFKFEPQINEANVQLNEADAVAEAESIIAQVPFLSLRDLASGGTKQSSTSNGKIATSVVSLLPRNDEIIEPLVNPKLPSWEVIAPQEIPIAEPLLRSGVSVKGRTVVEETEAVAQKAWDNHVITQAENVVNSLDETALVVSLATSGEIMEEVVEEEKVEEEERPREILEEEESIEKQFYLEDEQASQQRKYEIREAIIKARAEVDRLGLKKITGWLVAKFLPGEHEGNRSQVVRKKGPDGSYQETVEAISSSGEFNSTEEASKKFTEIVAEKKPVRYGKDGRRVGQQDVERVYKYHLVKPGQPHLEVVKRVVKKKVQQPSQNLVSISAKTEKPKTESSLISFPRLAEVFEQAT